MKMKLAQLIMTGAAVLSVAVAAADEHRTLSKIVRDTTVCGVAVHDVSMERRSGAMNVKMNVDLESLSLKGQRVAVFAPLIVKEADTLRLSSVGLYTRTRWFQYLRADESPVSGEGETPVRWSERPAEYSFAESVPYEDWMNGAELLLERCDYGCCHTLIDEEQASLTNYREVRFMPVFRYVHPAADAVKMRELAGRAYIDFPVNRTEIYPEYRKNPTELAKIVATIDSVRNDADVTVKRITIKGYASPESPYDNNTRLAKGRTATLKQYVRNLYQFDDDFIATDYEPEDWEGLRAFVETSGLEHREEILALIDDTTIEPDPKELKLKTTYPEEYRFLLQTVYPGLRHSDYTIEYTIRQFSDVKDIERLLHTQPQKLSLEEMFLLAQTYEEGSDAYNEVFEVAVRMYPNDETANLNAATAAMERGDLELADKYLAKAGESAEATYSRAILAGLRGDYAGALKGVRASADAGLADTEEMQNNIEDVISFLEQ